MPGQAILIGATGLVGGHCLKILLERYETVTAIARRSTGITHPRLTERRIDFERLGTIEIPASAHVYCALGTTIKQAGSEDAFRRVDFEYPRMLAQHASGSRGARFILVSSVGADANSRNFYLRIKGELEAAIQAIPLEAVHIFRPSFLVGERSEKRAGEAVGIAVAQALGFLLVGGLRKYRAIEAATVARSMVAAANKDAAGCFVYHYDEIRKLAD
jgi:uncharacterized protein YbjT (DUF2867 family)